MIDRLYGGAPVWLQNAGISVFGTYWYWLRFGGNYRAHVEAYHRRDRWGPPEWEAWTDRTVKSVLDTACRSVPWYRDHWTDDQVRAAKAGHLGDLPLLDKDPVRADPDAFVRDDVRVRRPLRFATSGSTGTPIESIWTRDELRAAMAVREVRSAGWAGVSFRDPRSTFSGRMVVPQAESAPPYWRYNRVEQQVYFSAFHLSPATARDYVSALHRYRPRWLTGYAVSYYHLARHIVQQRLRPPLIDAVITTSEKLTSEMRRTMREAYGCAVHEEYGTVEHALLATECDHGRLHVSPDVSVVEILDPDGSPCPPGTVGEVVVTTLARTYQPLIRFRLGDLAAWDPEPCPCGRDLPVLQEVVGRIEDVVRGPDGRELVRFHGIFVDQPHIVEGQVVQEALDRFRVRVVPTDDFSDDDADNVRRRMRTRLGAHVAVDVELVERIPREPSGKLRAVVSLLGDAP